MIVNTNNLKIKTEIEIECFDEKGVPTGKKIKAIIDEKTPYDSETGQYILEKEDFKEVE